MQYEDVQKQFNKVVEYSQNIPKAESDNLFAQWLEAKRDFIEAFDGKLIYEHPEKVSFELGTKEKNLRIDDFLDIIERKYNNYDLSEFIEGNRESFFINQVKYPYSKNGISIPAGMKLIKAFKFFENDKNVLNDLQSIASMIIQEDKIEGTLCLSVHPLDFLSASENNHNWRSCHALDGEYRSGNLSYMIDDCTIICYLRSKNMEKLPNFPEEVLWNSKKWRVWLYFSKDWRMIFAGRQYPFQTTTGLDFVKDICLPEAHIGNPWSNWSSYKIKYMECDGIGFNTVSPYVPINNELVKMKDLVVNKPNSLQFNDLLSSSCYDPVYCFRMSKDYTKGEKWASFPLIRGKYAKFEVGGEVKCLCCGNNKIELSETFMCNECELEYGECQSEIFEYCDNCGKRFILDDGTWVDGSEVMVCPDCAESLGICESCGCYFYSEDMVYDREEERSICRFCAEEKKEWQEEQKERNALLRF